MSLNYRQARIRGPLPQTKTYVMQQMQCNPCNATHAGMQCNPCNATHAMQPMQCNPCNAIHATHAMQDICMTTHMHDNTYA